MADETLAARIYDSLMNEDEEDRACEAIPEAACTYVPRNFFLNAANGASTKLAEQLANPGLVLPWLLSAIGAPAGMAGWLLPIRRAGSMIPQLAVAGSIRKVAKRKWFWTGAGITQAIALALMIPAALLANPTLAGGAILALMLLFSVASGVGSVSFSDVVGKTIPKRRRGRLLGVRATLGGILTLAAGLLMRWKLRGADEIGPYLILVGIAAFLWFFAALLFGMIREFPGATSGGRNALQETKAGWAIVRKSPGYLRFLLSRALLLLGIELALPYYSLHAQDISGAGLRDLSLYVIVTGLSAAFSSTVWGRLADYSSRVTMIVAGVAGAVTGAISLGFDLLPSSWQIAPVYAVVFFGASLSRAGTRVGRKTWVVDFAPEDDRPTYVAFANTLIGLVTVAGGLLGLLIAVWGVRPVIGILVLFSLAGAAMAAWMPEAEARDH